MRVEVDLCFYARELVNFFATWEMGKRRMDVGTYIAAAHANVGDPDDYVVGICDSWNGGIFYFGVSRAVEIHGGVFESLCRHCCGTVDRERNVWKLKVVSVSIQLSCFGGSVRSYFMTYPDSHLLCRPPARSLRIIS